MLGERRSVVQLGNNLSILTIREQKKKKELEQEMYISNNNENEIVR